MHFNHVDDISFTIEDEYKLALKLLSLADRMRVSYIYSLIKHDGKIKFIVSNPEKNDNSISEFKRMYLVEYSEAPEAAFAAFKDGKVKYDEYHDRWGNFRSVFFPLVMADGQPYVIGVDIGISQILVNSSESSP